MSKLTQRINGYDCRPGDFWETTDPGVVVLIMDVNRDHGYPIWGAIGVSGMGDVWSSFYDAEGVNCNNPKLQLKRPAVKTKPLHFEELLS